MNIFGYVWRGLCGNVSKPSSFRRGGGKRRETSWCIRLWVFPWGSCVEDLRPLYGAAMEYENITFDLPYSRAIELQLMGPILQSSFEMRKFADETTFHILHVLIGGHRTVLKFASPYPYASSFAIKCHSLNSFCRIFYDVDLVFASITPFRANTHQLWLLLDANGKITMKFK